MEDNKELVTEVTENVEETTEELTEGSSVEQPEVATETFTREQVDEMIAKKLARKEAKIRKEFDKKYGRLENVLKAGTGVETVEEMTDTFADFYTKKGIQIPTTPQYSDREMQILADAEANDIISSGYDDVVEEVDRLANIGVDNMTPQEKLIFGKLAKERTRIENEKELASIGVTKLDDDFKEFAKKLNPSMPLKEQYEMYSQLNPKKKGEPMGSMKNTDVNRNNGVKPYYSPEEASKFTRKDYDANPELFNAVCESMTKWK